MAEVTKSASFRIDLVNLCLWRRNAAGGDERLDLSPKRFDVLRYLAENAGRLVTHDELLTAVWRDVHVQPEVLKSHILAIRSALGDDSTSPRFIETQRGRGYRFIGAMNGIASSAPSPETNLRRYLTGVIGRQAELAELQACLNDCRMVTLIGPGGVGKTRLGVELGWRVLSDFPGGVWLIDLAPLSDPAQVVTAVATALRLDASTAEAVVGAIAATLSRRRSLMIFDNCEHLAGAAAGMIEALLTGVPGVSVVATSQQALHLDAEQLYLVRPLSVPPENVAIGGFAAVDLFVERANQADRLFRLGTANEAGVAEICRRLDGLPLALEMAAARLRMLGVEGLREGLDHRLKLLKGAPHADNMRHRSLQAVVEWSHGLLDPQERHLFRCLAAFPSSFTLEAAAAVAGGADRWAIVDAFDRLVDKSLVAIEGGDPPRYRLLETLRLFGGEGLRDSSDSDAVADRHARHFVDVLGRASIAWETTPDEDWLALHGPEVDNLRAALEWALAKPERRAIALALGASGLLLFHVLSAAAEGLRYFERLVPLIDPDTPPAIAAGLLKQAFFHFRDMPEPAALAYLERATSLYRALDDRINLGVAMMRVGFLLTRQGRFEQAKAVLAEASKLVGRSNRSKLQMALYEAVGLNALKSDQIAEGRTCFTQLLNITRTLKSRYAVRATGSLALLEYSAGDVDRAIELGREAVREARATPGVLLGYQLTNLAAYLLARGNPGEARSFLEEAFALCIAAGSHPPYDLQVWAVLGGLEGRLADAARLIGFVDAERVRTGQLRQKTEERLYGELSRRLEAGLPTAECASLKQEGASWTKPAAIKFVRSRLLSPDRAGATELSEPVECQRRKDGEPALPQIVPADTG
jgi:predicted ATPase/DNA-binding winged helix-turn-helix (wHTH) protein